MNQNKYKWVLTKNKKSNHQDLCFQFMDKLPIVLNDLTDYCILNWQNNWQIVEVLDVLNSKKQLKGIIIKLNSKNAQHINLILETLQWKSNKIPCMLLLDKNEVDIDHEQRFQLSMIMGKMALGKNTSNQKLREYYKYESYEIILQNPHLSETQKQWMNTECANVHYKILKKISLEVNNAFDNLELNGFHNGFNLNELLIRNSTIKGSIKSILRPFYKTLKRKQANNKLDLQIEINNAITKTSNNPRDWKKVLITGWYGTETIGDKAILGEIIHQLRGYNSNIEIIVSSIDMRVSWQTRIEMNLDITHVLITEMENVFEDNHVDAVIMGGGPLMESSQIIPITKVFDKAARLGLQRVIYGCGVGPIHSHEMEIMISHIIKTSTVAFYRDQESLDYALRLGANPKSSILACDPALSFVKRWHGDNPRNKKNNVQTLSTMLRKQTNEYNNSRDIKRLNQQSIGILRKSLVTFSENSSKDWQVSLFAMHAYWRGNDDRVLNAEIITALDKEIKNNSDLSYIGLFKTLSLLRDSDLSIAMRYHGHVFSIAFAIPFLSIDYTGKLGKVSNLLDRIEYKEHSITFNELEESTLANLLCKIENNNNKIKQELLKSNMVLEKQLLEAYEYFWN